MNVRRLRSAIFRITMGPLILVLCSIPHPAQQPEALRPTKADLTAAIDAYLQPYLDRQHLSGNLLVARGDEILYERSFGMANYELEVPNTPDTNHGADWPVPSR